MVHLSKLKALPRWAYVGVVGFLGAYSYSYLHADHPAWTDAARYGVLPLLQASGALVGRRPGPSNSPSHFLCARF